MVKVGNSIINQLEVCKDYFFYTWDIDAFDKLPFLENHPIPSPSFVLGERMDTVWQLLVCKEKRNPDDEKTKFWEWSHPVRKSKKKTEKKQLMCSKCLQASESGQMSDVKKCRCNLKKTAIGFKLSKVEDSAVWESVQYKVVFKANVSEEDGTEIVYEVNNEYKDDGNSFYQTDILHYIYGSDMKDEYLPLLSAKKLKIEVIIEYTYMDNKPLMTCSQSKLSKALKDLYISKNFADIIVKAGDFETLAHKNLLCTRAFDIDRLLQEYRPRIKKFTLDLNLEESILSAMLTFIYCSGLPKEFPLSKCPALYSAAKQYEVEGLAETVEELLKSILLSEACLECVNKMFGICTMSNDIDKENSFKKVASLILECNEQKLESVLATKNCSLKGHN